MQSIIIQANKGFLDEAIKLLKNLAKEQNQELNINEYLGDYLEHNLPILSDDEIYNEVKKRSKAIHSRRAKLLSHDEVKQSIKNHILGL
ncbi:Uncharacterised protein [Campylobacter sputorum subsp. bubulus]|uniref:Uncharacterized protein n=1 Tax=Campylobacter sputorum subsp. sputorum TaxID=32024 RepID=A0A381DJG5_9BACT|nr:hypothetical protein [Campylobacter sputorum]ASM35661.1 hypothetical protein CSPUT_1477 [Campylobacter sputorum aubsp. sputorum RM3237]KAB0582609.1 hypothetical protein F7P64_00230 [Campylobacter sputorum subsp. sputorum]QEL05853.1 hypothetical protein CSPT_1475 [Campylobacter sputorum subsp. sputorum]SUX07937.1 Uncharacterised protein [Campylobacter sputorum subsp. bubulus]SUX10631.1 Uncharacterised protein [Campylobacter sputorum subsp. sputorum]